MSYNSQSLSYPDIFFTPDFFDLFADTGFGGMAASFFCAGIDYQFYLRPVEGTPWFDIVSPYGYAGPVAVGENPDWPAYLAAFHAHCLERGIIAEFGRLHPFEANQRHLAADEILQGHGIVYIDLRQSDYEIRAGMDKGCRSAVSKARRYGLEVDFMPRISPAFVWLYLETMRRLDTDPKYIFNPTFFCNLEDWLKGRFTNISIKYRGKLIASALLLYHGRYGHYFLAGSDWGAREYCANNLLIFESIAWLRERDCRIFNLGGGLIHGDSLESFKQSFSPLSVPFFQYRKIHNQAVYDALCRVKDIDPASSGYFPAYRRTREHILPE